MQTGEKSLQPDNEAIFMHLLYGYKTDLFEEKSMSILKESYYISAFIVPNISRIANRYTLHVTNYQPVESRSRQ